MSTQILLLSKGRGFTFVDEEDFLRLSHHSWHLKDKYVCRSFGGRRVRLHREILGASQGLEIDHIDGNPLNNRKSNLRLCTRKENLRNRGLYKNSSSGYKGVSALWGSKSNRSWCARISDGNGKLTHIGTFRTPEEAALAYDTAAIRLYGKFARTNKALIAEYNHFHPLARRCPICGLAGQIACPHWKAA